MKLKSLLIIIILSLLFLALWFPKLYFNNLEDKAQNVYGLVEEGINKDDYKQVITLVQTHKSVVKKQKSISSVLPKKYKEYISKKIDLYDKYYKALDKFSILKQNEAEVKDVNKKREEFIKLLDNSKEQKTNAMDVYISLNTYVGQKENLKKIMDNGFITKKFFDSILADMDKNVEVYNTLNDAADNKIPITQMTQKIDEITKKYKDINLDQISNESYLEINSVKQKEWMDMYKEADREKYLVDSFYLTNNLGKVNINKNYTLLKTDLNGDGNNENVVISDTFFVYSTNNELIGRLSEIIPLIKIKDGSAKAYSLKKGDKKQVVRLDFPEQENIISTLFFSLYPLIDSGETVLPVCHKEKPESIADCLFISKTSEPLKVYDMDGDGLTEIDGTIDSKKFKFNGNYFIEIK